ncbi:MAG: HAD family hydrolase [Nitrosomonas sp.]|nr:MAG: HAD family hydrolase [Nitrosomonas sp.]
MYALSQPYPEMLQFIQELKQRYNLTIALTSNEGRDLAEYRIKTFHLNTLADFYFVSCFIYYQKPDLHFYKMALDIMQIPANCVLYIDDRENGIQAASALGIRGVVHKDLESTRQQVLALL